MNDLPLHGRPVKPRVGLFVTCLVDLMRPSVGFAAVKLLEDAGCIVEVPVQTCCGQPAYNSGDRGTTRDLAEQAIDAFHGYDYVVAPSGSCAGMIKAHYPGTLRGRSELARQGRCARRQDLRARRASWSTSWASRRVDAAFEGTVTYHDSCSGLRELGVKSQPRLLLASVEGLTLVEMNESDVCCGFGGTFAVKYGDISNAIVEAKAENVAASAGPDAARGRSRLPHEHGRQAQPRRQARSRSATSPRCWPA